ncbi:unnamed protein product [Heligmosomoides polygyrus]|uniref:Uncharacterized protein n=1 Tax=Heligmosomoides polygyrus TaxID=6339 RepID=A0A3P7U525_HELPZ|nr:unnamed protein product [Heligmosomoides polygyrus]
MLKDSPHSINFSTFHARLEHFWARRSRSLSPESSRNRRAPRRLTPSSRFSSSASSRV